MHAQNSHLAKLFKQVEAIRELIAQDCAMPDMEFTSIDDLVTGFEAYFGIPYRFFTAPDLAAELVRGIVLRFEDRVAIFLDEAMPRKWLRYIQVKEMCCTLLNDDMYVTQDPGELIELMVFEESANAKEGEAPLDLVSDMWAKYAAHELLLPHAIRRELITEIEGGATYYQIAERFDLPEPVVENCLREQYLDACDAAWAVAADLPHASVTG